MYETPGQTITYANMSYYSAQPLPAQNPNSAPVVHHQPVPDPFATYGPYPPPNYAAFGPQPAYYSDPNAVSYGALSLQGVQPPPASHGTNIDNLIGQRPQGLRKMVKKPKVMSKKKSASQSIWCNLCKVECNSTKHYEKHLTGKKHNKSLKLMYASTISAAGQSSLSANNAAGETGALVGQVMPTVSNVPEDLETKKQKLLQGGTAAQSLRVCTICNVACNGEIAFSDHLVGRRHFSQERALHAKTNLSTSFGSDLATNSQKTPVVGVAWCEVCKISCTSSEGLVMHRQGKKHKKNVENLRKSISDPTGLGSTSTPVAPVNVPNVTEVIPEIVVPGISPEPESVKKKGARSMAPEDLEAKKRKVLESGTAAYAVKTCSVCNVVCNSETVFNTHLAGQKHASMVKRAVAGGDPNNQLVTALT